MEYKEKLIGYLTKNGKKKKSKYINKNILSGKSKRQGLYFYESIPDTEICVIEYSYEYYIELKINLNSIKGRLSSDYTPNRKFLGYYDEFNPKPDNDPDDILELSRYDFETLNECIEKFNEKTGRSIPLF